MSDDDQAERTCSATGLRLVPAMPLLTYRVSRDKYGGLSALPRRRAAGATGSANRFDTVGTTLYFADSKACAFAEVLNGFKQARAALGPDAEAAGEELGDYVALVTEQAIAHGIDHPWAVSADWQMARSIYTVRLPGVGWWVRVDHPDTLSALGDLRGRLVDLDGRRPEPPLWSSDLEGGDRAVTTAIAGYVRDTILDDGSRPLGIEFSSRTLEGRCYAWWDRRTDDGVAPGVDDAHLVSSENVGIAELHEVARRLGIPVLPGRRRP